VKRFVSAAVAVGALAIMTWWFGFYDAAPDADAGTPSPGEVHGVDGLTNSGADRVALESSPSSLVARGVSTAVFEGARAPASANRVLSGRCVDDEGNPVPQAEVSWAPLWSEAMLGPRRAWSAVDWSALDAATRWTRSEGNGEFGFGEAPDGATAGPSVVWFTAPGRNAEFHLLREPFDPSAAQDLGAIVLHAEGAPRFSVVDSSGAAVAQARIEVLGTAAFEQPSDDPLVARCPRVFHRFLDCDAKGRAQGFAFRSSCAVRAVKADLRSGFWRTKALRSARREFVLGASFSVSGTVKFRDAVRVDGPFFVHCDAYAGQAVDALAQGKVNADGSWGPLELPWSAEYKTYRVSAEGRGAFVYPVELEQAQPGAALTVDLEAVVAETLTVTVEGEDQQPLAGARVVVYTFQRDHWTPSSAYSDTKGFARVDGCVRGPALLRVSCEGHSPFESAAFDLDEASFAETQTVTLHRAGRITGRVTFEGKPANNFDVQYWKGEPTSFQTKSFKDREDGTFELDTAPLGEVWLFAASHPLGQSLPVAAQAVGAEAAHVELEIAPALRARGRVIDAATLEPIAGAKLRMWSRGGTQMMTELGVGVATGADGAFRLEGVVPEATGIMVTADGYGMVTPAASGDVLDEVLTLADVPLTRKQALTVRLRSTQPEDFTDYMLTLSLQDWQPAPQTFDVEGRSFLPAITPGRVFFTVTSASGALLQTLSHFSPGRDAEQVFELDPSTTLSVTARTEDGREFRDEVDAMLSYPGVNGRSVQSYALCEGRGKWRFMSVPTRSAVLSLVHRDGILCARPIALRDGPNEVDLKLADEPLALRVVNARGAPVPNAIVRLDTPQEPGWYPFVTTDAEGRAWAPSADLAGLRASIYHDQQGLAANLPVRKPTGPEDVVELVLDAEGDLELLLSDGGTALPAIKFHMFNSALSLDFGDFIADARGVARVPRVARGDGYCAVFDQPGLWRTVAALRVDARRARLSVDVRRTGDLELVVESGGSPLAGAELRLESEEYGVEVGDWIAQRRVECPQGAARTDGEGKLLLRGLPRGDYRWTCGASKGRVSVPPRAAARETLAVRL
jgi:hypothetical protein